jgi:amino acid transporter
VARPGRTYGVVLGPLDRAPNFDIPVIAPDRAYIDVKWQGPFAPAGATTTISGCGPGPCTPTTIHPARGRSGPQLCGDRFDFARGNASSLALRAVSPEGFEVLAAELPWPAGSRRRPPLQPNRRICTRPRPGTRMPGAGKIGVLSWGGSGMATAANDRVMASERIAPGMLPRVLGSFDMVVIFVAVVLFIVNASAVQPAGPAAFSYWILGFLLFLIPGALITAQLGQMFPQEGSLYVWTQKALGPFWGFFAGFCAWWPGVLVMVATGDAVVTLLQFIFDGGLPKAWQQGLVILAVLWFSAGMALMRLRMTQNYVNWAVVAYGAAIFVIGLAGILWLVGAGHAATPGMGDLSSYKPFQGSSWTIFGLVILALLGIEVPLNMGVEIVHMRSIKKYLFWGSIVVMAAYLWVTLGTMLALDATKSEAATTDILRAVQVGFYDSHALAVIVALVMVWFFVSNTVVYNYSFSRLLFVSGLEKRMPSALGRVNERKVPAAAVLTQTALSSIFVVAIFNPFVGGDNTQKAYWLFQAAVTVIWCISMVLLFFDIFLVKRAFPALFEEVRSSHPGLLYASGVVGMCASAFGAYVTFRSPWTPLFTVSDWRLWLAILVGVSALAAIAIYSISQFTRRREMPETVGAEATPSPVG